MEGTAGALAVAAGRALGAGSGVVAAADRSGHGLWRGRPVAQRAALARQGRCLLPEDVLAAHGLTVHEAMARPDAPALRAVLAELVGWGQERLRRGAGRLPRAVLAAGLVAVFARRDLRRLDAPAGPRGLGDRLAVLSAVLARRV